LQHCDVNRSRPSDEQDRPITEELTCRDRGRLCVKWAAVSDRYRSRRDACDAIGLCVTCPGNRRWRMRVTNPTGAHNAGRRNSQRLCVEPPVEHHWRGGRHVQWIAIHHLSKGGPVGYQRWRDISPP
jgi:hypothetical protein